MSDTRTRIRRHVRNTPGVHFNQVGCDLDIATGQVQYHLHRLVRNDELAVKRISGRTQYFDSLFDLWERRALVFSRRETPREILVRVCTDGPKLSKTLASDLGLAQSTISWHVLTLAENGVVEKSDERPLTLTLNRPDRTAELLEMVSPSLPDRLVDRFVWTVDEFFE
jgi:predicted transcriptional regulator